MEQTPDQLPSWKLQQGNNCPLNTLLRCCAHLKTDVCKCAEERCAKYKISGAFKVEGVHLIWPACACAAPIAASGQSPSCRALMSLGGEGM